MGVATWLTWRIPTSEAYAMHSLFSVRGPRSAAWAFAVVLAMVVAAGAWDPASAMSSPTVAGGLGVDRAHRKLAHWAPIWSG
jgi:hypothetical protein